MVSAPVSARTSVLVLAAASWLAGPAPAQSTWVVDVAGGGDFTQIAAAIAAVPSGDTLLVMPGSYEPFTLAKRLAIVAHPSGQPLVLGTASLAMPDGGATLAGLELLQLELLGCGGMVLLDAVTVQGGAPASCVTTHISGCENVVIQRSTLDGKDGDAWCESVGALIEGSRVALVDCAVTGGDGWGDTFWGYDGRPGLQIEAGSQVLLARTRVTGGNGGSPDVIFDGVGGNGAEAIEIAAGAACTVRGNSNSPLLGGAPGWAGFPGSPPFASVTGGGELTISGVSYSPGLSPGLVLTQPSPAQPFLHVVGNDGPGETKRFNLLGPMGQFHWLHVSLAPADLALPALVDGALFLDPGASLLALPLVALGQETSVNLLFTLPAEAGLTGVTAVFQSFAQGAGATAPWLASNPAYVVLR